MTTSAALATVTLVWIDTDEAFIVRWEDRALIEQVPCPARSDRDRRACMRAFLDAVIRRVPGDDDVMVVGPGTVRERLERTIRRDDRERHRTRRVRSAPSERLSQQELVEHVRRLAGETDGWRATDAANGWTVTDVANGWTVPDVAGAAPDRRPGDGGDGS